MRRDLTTVFNASDAIVDRYLYDQSGQVLSEDDPAGMRWYLADHQGSTRNIISASGGGILETIDYDAFGNIIPQEPSTGGNLPQTVNLDDMARATPQYSDDLASTGDVALADWSSDDLAVIIGVDEDIDVDDPDPSNNGDYTVTLPDDAILIRNNWYYWGAGYGVATVRNVSGDKSYTIDHDSSVQDLEDGGFATRPASVGVAFSEMQAAGWVDQNGVANFRIAVIGDTPRADTTVTSTIPSLPRFLYTGQEHDAETGLDFYNARYYDAQVGQFLSEDPAGDGMNPYEYVGSSPVTYNDPTGMMLSGINGAYDPHASYGGATTGTLFSPSFYTLSPGSGGAVVSDFDSFNFPALSANYGSSFASYASAQNPFQSVSLGADTRRDLAIDLHRFGENTATNSAVAVYSAGYGDPGIAAAAAYDDYNRGSNDYLTSGFKLLGEYASFGHYKSDVGGWANPWRTGIQAVGDVAVALTPGLNVGFFAARGADRFASGVANGDYGQAALGALDLSVAGGSFPRTAGMIAEFRASSALSRTQALGDQGFRAFRPSRASGTLDNAEHQTGQVQFFIGPVPFSASILNCIEF